MKNIIYTKSLDFALRIINLHKYLRDKHQEYTLSKQILRSGTSIGANITEGYHSQSDADFILKYSIAQKECAETLYWLELLYKSDYIDQQAYLSMTADATEILKIIISSIKTVKKRLSTTSPH